MCRMFGMAATTAISPRDLLHDAPRSLRALSREHPDGWGIALHDTDWTIERDTSCADGPGSPRGFYLRYGFVDTGRVMWSENVLALDLG